MAAVHLLPVAHLLLLGLSLPTIVTGQHDASVINGSYLVVYPNEFDAESTFTIHFKLLRPMAYETVKARIIYSNTTRADKEMSLNITLSSGNLTLKSGMLDGKIDIAIPKDLPIHNVEYKLVVQGNGTQNFETYTYISRSWYNRDRDALHKHHIFIQTDKAAYKTGQQVKFRAFVLNGEMKPINHLMDIYVYDPKLNKIQEHINVSDIYGVSSELDLDGHPPLGRWKIMAILKNNCNEVQEQYFDVQEYVLPKFYVEIKIPPFGTVSNPELKGKVIAKYTYGKPVKGYVTLKVSKLGSYWSFYEPKALQTEFEINGEADFSIATDTLLKFDPSLKYDTLTVEAIVTEKETGEIRSATNSITFHEDSLRLEFARGDNTFKPGFKYTTHLKVTQPDGRPLTSIGDRVRVRTTLFTEEPSSEISPLRPPSTVSRDLMKFIGPFPQGNVLFMPDMYVHVQGDGVIHLDMDIAANVATGHIETSLKDVKTYKNIQRFRTASKVYINLDMKTSYIKVGKQAEFIISSNTDITRRVTYHIVKNKKILETNYISVSPAYIKNTFYVTMTSDMVPESHVIAYFYHEASSEIIADALKFTVDMTLRNDVRLMFHRSQVAPGTNVSLNVKADPHSQVFLLAVDKSVLLQRTGNDITTDKVYKKFGINQKTEWEFQNTNLPEKPSSADAIGIFNDAGLDILSDADLYNFDLWSYVKFLNDKNPAKEHRAKPKPISHPWKYSVDSRQNEIRSASMAIDSLPTFTFRKNFPETWIWTNATASSDGSVDISATIPDTITDWVATGFALNKDTGLGVATIPANITAYLPFFVSLHLPFSILSNEVAVIQAIVFNYYPHDMHVLVKLKNSTDDFVVIEINYHGQETEKKEVVEKCILVKSNDASSAYFIIKALKIGTITLEVEASSSRGKDTVQRQLIVKAPGKQEEKNFATFVSLLNSDSFESNVAILFPPKVVPNSQRVQVSVIGDIFGASLDNLEQLIQMPSGCGEQNMVRFAPAVYAAKYLNVSNRYTDEMKVRILRIMNTGYQRELTYQRVDGSFSSFGDADENGSLWLTAFVIKTFAQASEFIYIDPKVVEKAIKFILNHQNRDGSFNSTGFVHNKAMQGGSASTSKSLAAYVLISLIEIQNKEILTNVTVTEDLRRSVLSVWSYLSQLSGKMASDYEIALAANALSLMGRGGANDLLNKLKQSNHMRMEAGAMYWHHDVSSQEVEIAAYALLSYARQRDQTHGLPILKWLLRKRNPYGGFVSTQDTVVALQGLAEFALVMYTADVNMTLNLQVGAEKLVPLKVNADNMDVLQFKEILPDASNVKIEAKGKGFALVEVSIFYNVLQEAKSPSFDLVVTTNGTEISKFTVKVCMRYLGNEDSGMVLLDIGFPSGYSHTRPEDNAPKAVQRGDLSPIRSETNNGRLVLYFNSLGNDMRCYTADVARENTVGRLEPANVRVYSYYDTDKSAMTFYLPELLKNTAVCAVCGKECGCVYDSEAIPLERCTGVFQSLMRIVEPIDSPSGTKTVYRSLMDPNVWKRGNPLPVTWNRWIMNQLNPTVQLPLEVKRQWSVIQDDNLI